MKTLIAVHVVQFSLWEFETFQIGRGGTGFIGPNGAGKTSLVDAVQIAMVGGHGQHLHFNAQSVHKDSRSIRAYALGTTRSGEGEQGIISRKRDTALSYISLVFRGEKRGDVLSVGICIHATTSDHRIMGLYVLPGIELKLEHHLEDLGAQGKAPIEWELFAEFGRSHTRAAGLTPTITTRPETYIQELVHNVKQGVDVRKFLRAFGHSINLKAVSSVGDFLRGYLVEATPIDKRGTLQHIKTLRSLGRQIDDVTAQLAQLETLDKRYARLTDLHRQRAVAQAAGLQVRMEEADAQASTLGMEVTRIEAQLRKHKDALISLENKHQALRTTYERLLSQLSADPEAQNPAQLKQLRQAHAETVKHARKDVDRLALQLREAMSETATALEIQHVQISKSVADEMQQWDSWAKNGYIATQAQLEAALETLTSSTTQLNNVRDLARREESKVKALEQSSNAKLQALDQGKRITDDDVATATALFDQAGIGYEPVASLVHVTDMRWRGPIETFLSSHRLALVVEAGREDEAVDLIRRQRISNVTIVQPEHLRDEITRRPASNSVAALLDGSNSVAVAYLRRIFGRMKQVQSTEQLRYEPRAMTMDYMISANGGTKRLRPLDEKLWTLGVKLTNEDRTAAIQENRKAATAAHNASQYLRQIDVAFSKVQEALNHVTQATYADAVAQHAAATRELNATADPAALPRSERLKKLHDSVEEARHQSDVSAKDVQSLRDEITGHEATLPLLTPQLTSARNVLKDLERAHTHAISDQDCDQGLLPDKYERLQERIRSIGADQALIELAHQVRGLELEIPKVQGQVRDGFVDFINAFSIGLVEERSDWRKAHMWVGRHARKLSDSTLKEYRKQAEDAREAAEQSFRSDIKFKMREAIQRVKLEINDLNSILKTCPAFTNGEKYQFVATPSPAHRELYDLIDSSPETGGDDLFNQHGMQSSLLALLEDSESGKDRGNNPLEDYRLLFNFDLQIMQDGKVVDLLSKRMGVASNGEHRVPFYVIAGAALATAYRIKPGERKSGAGLMILDEAFYGMDAQNSYVTANFLKSLGLQLMMAGPDSDVGKLTPLMDNYYDLARYGYDVFAEHVVIKEAAHELFVSDIPMLHPELIDAAEAQLLAAAGAK